MSRLLILLHVSVCLAFTKDHRTFSVDFDYSAESSLRVLFDRTITPLEIECTKLCVNLRCINPTNISSVAAAVKVIMDRENANTFGNILGEFYNRTLTSNWLSSSDAGTQSSWLDANAEIKGLIDGVFAPRAECRRNSATKLANRNFCLFADTFPGDSQSANINAATFEILISAAEHLFNYQWYDHAEAITYFALKQEFALQLDLMVRDTYNRALILLTEITKEKGIIHESVFFRLQLIDAKSLISPVSSAVHRLRLLLTLPSIPPEESVAVAGRQQMISDLQLFLIRTREDSVVLSIKVSTHYSESASPCKLNC